MKIEMVVTITGATMFVVGLILFYSIELGQTDPVLRSIKNIGTFVGLCGMGVVLAGILLHFTNRSEPPIKENYDV